jgi:catechol 2,3-dioxygenase-like lactoylglutathione lyase family enzyme
MTDAMTTDDVGDLHLATVVVNVQDMRRAVDFWTAALGYQPRETSWDPNFSARPPAERSAAGKGTTPMGRGQRPITRCGRTPPPALWVLAAAG